MRLDRVLSRRTLAMTAAVAAAVVTPLVVSPTAGAAAAAVTLPPAHANFDYQIGGAYTPPTGVKVVSRDHTASPAAGLYNICYVNAFQTQPGAEGEWDADLLLQDANGEVVYDGYWGEAVLDIRTDDKRKRIAEKVNGWVDDCASKGFQAVEPDNFDTFTRYSKLLTQANAEDMIQRLSTYAHGKGLAIGQKNTAELSGDHADNGLDFAIAEECGDNDECDVYTKAFGNNVIAIEYTDEGMATACEGFGDKISVVRRDEDVTPIGSSGYVRETC